MALGICCREATTHTTKVVRQALFFFATIYCGLDSHGSSRRASLRNAWGWMAGQTAQNPRSSSPHYDRRRTKVSRSLVAGRAQAAFCFARLVMSRPSMIRKLPWRLRNPVGDRSICWNISRISMERKLASIYYSFRGYWKGLAAIKNISATAKVTEQQAKDWLKKQAIWQIYLPAPRHIPRPKFDIATPNEVHQADLIFLPHERVGGRPFAMLSRSLTSPAATKRLSL